MLNEYTITELCLVNIRAQIHVLELTECYCFHILFSSIDKEGNILPSHHLNLSL